MSRFERETFDPNQLAQEPTDEGKNRRLFHWWCDEGEHGGQGNATRPSDRLSYIASLQGQPTPFPSRAPRQDDPAPPVTQPAPQGFRQVWLLSSLKDVQRALTEPANFSNRPYAALGGASFLLGLDPGPDATGVDWHACQKALVKKGLEPYDAVHLRMLAHQAVQQAALTQVTQADFDLAAFAEQAALRYLGLLWGYGFQDHGLLEDASRATYRALQYLAVGQHFVTEPGTLPAAQQALARLIDRTSALMEQYDQLWRAPRRYGAATARDWPAGVQPWSEAGLSDLGEPLLKCLSRLRDLPDPNQPHQPVAPLIDRLSGRDRALVAATLLAGTVGNVQSAVCLLVRAQLQGSGTSRPSINGLTGQSLEDALYGWLASTPPTPVLPRRTRAQPVKLDSGETIPPDTDCLLLLEGLGKLPGQEVCPRASCIPTAPHVWGNVATPGSSAIHPCLGKDLSLPLIAALVQHVMTPRTMPGLTPALDALTGEVIGLQRLWGFGCTHYPLRFDREQVRMQRNLIVSMRIKQPVADHAGCLRRLIAGAVPRIDAALVGFGGVHFAWFEFSDDDTHLVLRTIYDGSFEAYIKHFAVNVGELFDGLFEHLEDAPPRPVTEHPDAFIATIRRYNRAPLADYLFTAYPGVTANQAKGGATP